MGDDERKETKETDRWGEWVREIVEERNQKEKEESHYLGRGKQVLKESNSLRYDSEKERDIPLVFLHFKELRLNQLVHQFTKKLDLCYRVTRFYNSGLSKSRNQANQ